MIRSFRQKGLRQLHDDDNARGIIGEHAQKLRDILARLDAASEISDLDLPGFRLHPLKGELSGYWAITVRANWRMIFRFENGDAWELDYIDYH